MYLSTKMRQPMRNHEQKLNRIAQYINGTKTLGLRFYKSDLQLYCSADASFGNHKDRKSQSGIMITLGQNNAPIQVISRKQKLVTRSSTEAELVALNLAVEELLPLRHIMEELGYSQKPIIVEQDNKSTIILATRGSGRSERARSIDIKYFWVSEQIQNRVVEIKYEPTKTLKSDGLTKVLVGEKFLKWRKDLLNQT